MGIGWLRVSKVAQYLDCSRDTVYRLLSAGELEWSRVRGARRVSRESIDAYLDRNRGEGDETEKNFLV